METSGEKKPHRQRQSGPKAQKKKSKNKHEQDLTPQQRNPKAFAIQHARKTAKLVQRSQDLKTKKQHIPLVDRTPVEPPPVVVGVVGPPKVGKTTLLKCVVKNFTRQRLTKIQGPVTVVSGKMRRLTLIECNNDINSMIDVAKVADLVLLLVDASFGFEMETFEFLNICQVHGFPRIMGVLTHLDSFKDNKRMRKTKKRLKHRFWTEVYQGAKLFYLSGMVNGEYQKTEVHNLCRFISVMKFRPLVWRTTHPYVVVDRVEDITDPEKVRQDCKCDRRVSLYGYVHGTHMKSNISVHIPGCGDFTIQDMHFLPDPCPTPDREKRRSLSQKERLIYAPMSGVGGIVYDKDAVYIDLGGSHSHTNEEQESKPANDLVASLLSVEDTLDSKITSSKLDIFSSHAKDSSSPSVTSDGFHTKLVRLEDGRFRRKVSVFDEQDTDSEAEGEDASSDEGIQEDLEQPPQKKSKQFQEPVAEAPVFADSDDDLQIISQDEFDSSLSQSADFSVSVDFSEEAKQDPNKFVENSLPSESESDSDDEDSEDDDEVEEKGSSPHEGHSESKKRSSDSVELFSGRSSGKGMSFTGESSSGKKLERTKEKGGESSKEVQKKRTGKSDKVSSANSVSKLVESIKCNIKQKGGIKTNENTSAPILRTKHSGNKIDGGKFLTRKNCSGKDTDDTDEDDESDDDSSADSDTEEEKITGKISIRQNKKGDDLQKSDESDDERSESADDDDGAVDDDEEEDMEEGEGDEENEDEEDNESNMEDDSEEEQGHLKWKSNLTSLAAEAFRRRQAEKINYRKLIYGQDETEAAEEEEDDELGGLFKVLKDKSDKSKTDRVAANSQDCSRFIVSKLQDWNLEEVQNLIRDCFVTGQWDKSEDAATRLQQDDELFGDFEDLETGEMHKTEDKTGSGDDSEEGEGGQEESADKDEVKKKSEMTANERRMEKKRKLKEMFDSQYDLKGDTEFYDNWKAEMEEQAKLNRAEFENLDDETRVQYEGFRPGMYVRTEISDVPCEFVTNFDPTYPVILGGLLNVEENVGYVQARLKKHRWHKKILKTRNPVIISLGWRRFQTLPLYSIQDHNLRNRLLKYTPEHLHCHVSFWGPITPQGAGLLAVESVSGTNPHFRIAATGVVLELDKSMQIVKKLKLTGTPFKIYKKTAFIQGMFNSSLEVAKFEGASIRTVSGLRGQIKKAVKTPEGAYRATFEDKILLSDIVFLRAWYPVEVPQFYNPVTSLLLPQAEKNMWVGMKTVGQLRREKGLQVPQNQDSLYRKVERRGKVYKPLTIPRDLQKELPFKDTPKILKERKDSVKRVTVVREPHEAKVAKVMHMLKALHEHKMKSERMKMRERAAEHQKKSDFINRKREKKQKEVKKQIFRVLGKIEKRKNKHKNRD